MNNPADIPNLLYGIKIMTTNIDDTLLMTYCVLIILKKIL